MTTKYILGVALVAVFLCLLFSYLTDDGNKNEPTIEGEWTSVSIAHGYISDGQPVYEVEDRVSHISISLREDGFHDIYIDDDYLIGVYYGGVLKSSYVNEDIREVYLYLDGDRLTMTGFEHDNWGVTICDYVRDGTDQSDFQSKYSEDQWPSMGTKLDCILAERLYPDHIGELDENTKFMTVIAKEDRMVFYKADYSDKSTKYFTAVPCGDDQWLGVYGIDSKYIIQHITFTEGNIEVYGKEGGITTDIDLYYLWFDNGSQGKTFDLDLKGKVFQGFEAAKFVNKDGEILREFRNNITLTVDNQDENLMVMSTVYGDGSFEDKASWVALADEIGGDCTLTVRSTFVYDGVKYIGDYYGFYYDYADVMYFTGVAYCWKDTYLIISQAFIGEDSDYEVGFKDL